MGSNPGTLWSPQTSSCVTFKNWTGSRLQVPLLPNNQNKHGSHLATVKSNHYTVYPKIKMLHRFLGILISLFTKIHLYRGCGENSNISLDFPCIIMYSSSSFRCHYQVLHCLPKYITIQFSWPSITWRASWVTNKLKMGVGYIEQQVGQALSFIGWLGFNHQHLIWTISPT